MFVGVYNGTVPMEFHMVVCQKVNAEFTYDLANTPGQIHTGCDQHIHVQQGSVQQLGNETSLDVYHMKNDTENERHIHNSIIVRLKEMKL